MNPTQAIAKLQQSNVSLAKAALALAKEVARQNVKLPRDVLTGIVDSLETAEAALAWLINHEESNQ